MGEQFEVLKQVGELRKLLTLEPPIPNGVAMPRLKTIYSKPEFISWKENAIYQLQTLKQEPIITETIKILNGFNGWRDESDFEKLQSKIDVIIHNAANFIIEDKTEDMPQIHLGKGTIVHTAFDEYTLVNQIGSGGNGRVFAANNSDGEVCAIKFVEKDSSKQKLKRFKNEINFCEHHKHKNIVPVLDRGQAFLDGKDFAFYVMPQYADTLRDKIRSGIPEDKALDIFIGLLDGLKYAHEHDTIHRDIKPENIMFAKDSFEPVICDFGIAHFSEDDLITMVETKATDRMANFQYAAPEQRKRGGNICFQTDIYALALILNEMFTGEIPQAVDHKKIEDVNSNYKYLDDLFDQLYRQKPEDRLYPEVLILSELKALAEQYQRETEKERLQAIINDVIEPENFDPSIQNIEFKNGCLIFTFDAVLPSDWFQILKNGDYNHSCIMGYETYTLSENGKNQISLPIRGSENQDTIISLVNNVKDWVVTVTRKYSQEAKRKAIADQKRKEAARIAEIKRIEKEEKMSATINAVLKELLS